MSSEGREVDAEVEVEDNSNAKILEEFKSTLDGLTFNSRPMITTLTQLAEENMSLAQEFVGMVENRVEKCVPSQKLYAFYVMDSICKNAGSPYTIYFSKNLHKLFRKAYLLVDNQTRTKMISMFKTWLSKLVGVPSDTKLQAKVAILKQLRQELQKEQLAPEF
ncbi:hypothetical protein C6P43_004067, partial [Kluyveromyces marxianus]